jgi:hypothetical protein
MRERIPTANEIFFGALPSDAAQTEALEKSFFRSVGLPNGTWKTTKHRRLDDLNALVRNFLPANRPLEIMDVAVSSGVSTLEWQESLERAGIECRITAGDAAVHAFLLSLAGGTMRALVDRQGRVLQYEVAGRGFEVPVRKRFLPVLFLPVLLMKLAGRLAAPALRDAHGAERGARFGIPWRAVRLVSPTLRNRIEVVEDDILVNRGYMQCFHVLRAANILNLGYFDSSTLTTMLTNLRNRLRPGGVLIVCRTSPQDVNSGTVLSLAPDGRLRVLARLNGGSEVEALALALPPARVA